jgi:hypothetical protein
MVTVIVSKPLMGISKLLSVLVLDCIYVIYYLFYDRVSLCSSGRP